MFCVSGQNGGMQIKAVVQTCSSCVANGVNSLADGKFSILIFLLFLSVAAMWQRM